MLQFSYVLPSSPHWLRETNPLISDQTGVYLAQIGALLPEEALTQVERAGGQFHQVIVINRRWVFRFPRYREGIETLASETKLLTALRGKLPLPIPDPVFERFDPPVPGLALLGYRRLDGDPLSCEAVHPLPLADKQSLAAQLAGFLVALHTLPVWELPAPPRVADQRPEWEALYAEVRQKLWNAMHPSARRAVADHFERYLDDPRMSTFSPVLRHGDFGADNILWDEAAGRITGVIDFSFCGLGDPAIDLAGIAGCDADIWDALLAAYAPGQAQRATLVERANFYRGTFALMEALDGLHDHDAEAYQRGMAPYQNVPTQEDK